MFGQAFLPDSSYQQGLHGLHLLLSSPLILEGAFSYFPPSDPGRKLKFSCPTPAGQALCVFVCLSP